MHENVVRMALVKPHPILVAEDVKIQIIEFCEMEIGEFLGLFVGSKFLLSR